MTKISHEHLWPVTRKLPEDYEPYGKQKRPGDEDEDETGIESPTGYYGDCSSGCKWYVDLVAPFAADWGVCTNPASHRCGLLTFEHQGCLYFEPDRE